MVFDSGLDIILFLIDDAAGEDGGLKFFEEIEVSFDEAGLDEGGFGLEIGIGDFGAFGEIADGVADFEADIPERVEEAIAEGGHEGGGFSALDCGSVMKEHQIDVAVWVQFAATVATDGDEGDFREFGIGPFGIGEDGFGDGADEDVHHVGASGADVFAAFTAAVKDLEAVGFDLEEVLVAGEFLGRFTGFGQRQPCGGVGFDFFEKRGHELIRSEQLWA